MNWDAISFDWNHLRAFLATAEHGSFSAAARVLRQTQPTLSRQISALEADLNVTLFERGTRVMQLTDAGEALLSHVRSMGEAATRVSLVATGQAQSVGGVVRITCSDGMAAYGLPQLLVALRLKHPGIRIELFPDNNVSDLTRRDADIAIRHVEPEQPDLFAKRIRDIEVGLFASKAYVAQLSNGKGEFDVGKADFIGFGDAERLTPQLKAIGLDVSADRFGVVTNNGCAMYELARDGAGIALLPISSAKERLGLVQIMGDRPLFSIPTWLVTHREVKTSKRIRIVFDHLASNLGKDQWSGLGRA